MNTVQTIVWQVKSRYALVTCINNGRGVIVEKEIAPENVNSENALWVNETSIYFRNKLRDLGVLLAEPYTFTQTGSSAIQCSPYVGLDLEKVFREGKATPEILARLVSTMSGVLGQTEREVGLDARLSNFCLSPGENVYYVDTFPPLVFYEGEYIVHFPNPTDPELVEQELRRKFDPLGILRRMRFSILAQDVGISEEDFLVAIRTGMGETFGKQVADFFQNLPGNQKIDQALAELSLDDPEAIRELALRFMPPRGETRKQYFSQIFDLSSHFCPLKITDEERVSRIRKLFTR